MKPHVLMNALCILSLLLSPRVFAGNEVTDSTGGQLGCALTVRSIPDSAHVNLDGKDVGLTPLSIDSISPGAHHLQVQDRDEESWLTQPVLDTIQLAPGEQRTLMYNLHRRYLITSSPFGADVVLNDSVLGTTPFLIPSQLAQQPLLLRKQGYEQSTIQFEGSRAVSVQLNALVQDDLHMDSYFKETYGKDQKTFGLYATGAATILSGVAAAYFKIKADDKYQQYLLNGDPKLLSQTNRLDTTAGIAIVATQIGIGLFTYLILSR